MGQALYRKYRPRSLDEVIGQEHIAKTLQQALKQERISHAYLFTGPRGVGKTSVARIWAHAINNLPYKDDSPHLDIIEIDAASNRRIDEIRDLRDKVYISPTSAKYKVYIIDEVHMLTREAFNALLKTLEEPPAHAVFILATTDAHKLPDTIISRTQRFSFQPVDRTQVVSQLRTIADAEKIKISDEALELMAEHGEGSFRDTISLLDQAGSQSQQIGDDDIRRFLGIPPAEAIKQLAAHVTGNASPDRIMTCLTDLYRQGYQAAAVASQLSGELRSQLANNKLPQPDDTLNLLARLLEVEPSHYPERYLEIILLQTATYNTSDAAPSPKTFPPAEPAAEGIPPAPQSDVRESADEPPKKTSKPLKEKLAEPPPKTALDETLWPAVLQVLKKSHNTLYGVARMAEARLEGNKLTLAFAFPFHQKRLNEKAHRQLLSKIIKEVCGQTVSVECTVDKAAKAQPAQDVKAPAPAKAAGDDLSAISNIFGGAELLES